MIVWHINICVHCADGVLVSALMSKNETTHLYKRQHKRKMAYKQLRTEIMGQNPES